MGSLGETRFVILCVCTGNICRSPFAERLLATRLGPDVEVSSAGTYGVVGAPIAEPMARRLRSIGVDGDGFAARRLLTPMVTAADLMLGLTAAHRGEVVELQPAAVRRSFTLLEFTRLLDELDPDLLPAGSPATRLRAAVPLLASRRTPSMNDDVDDPFGRPESAYEGAAREIEGAVGRIAAIVGATAWDSSNIAN